MSVAISPKFDDIVLGVQNRLGVKKATAVTIVVLIANLFGTTLFMSLGILIAATLAGVPVFPGA